MGEPTGTGSPGPAGPEAGAARVALSCRGLEKRYGQVVAVDGVDLEVFSGECFGLLGPNGAGKTTTVEILEGLTRPDRGEVLVLGRPWGRGEAALRERLGVQLQETQLAEKLTVMETIRLFRSFYRRGHDPAEVIRAVDLLDKGAARVGKLSGGQKQRLALACSLVSDPEVLFLDEPTIGLDPQARVKIWDMASAFHDRGGTILITTHYMEEAARLCDRVAIMDQGKVIALGAPDDLIASLHADQIIEFEPDGAFDPTPLSTLPGARGWKAKNHGFTITVVKIAEALPALLAELSRQRAVLVRLTTHQPTLEDVFMRLTGKTLREGA